MLLYKREVQNSPRADMHTGLQMLFLDVSCLTLLIQQLGELTKNSLEIRENRVRIREIKISLEIREKKISLEIRENRSAWLPTSNNLRGLGWLVQWSVTQNSVSLIVTSPVLSILCFLTFVTNHVLSKVHQIISFQCGKCNF